ncbi:MAG: hypothetical protein LBD53_01055 [Tannerella sp.]|jgi:hypothetical protein|nr:hypothetical protein [Tannerella sp.]
MNIKVLKYQSLFDIAIQETGDASNVFAIAAANGMSITDTPPESVFVPDTIVTERKTKEYFAARGLKPATGISTTAGGNSEDGEGVEFWYVEYDFTVN